MIERFGRERLAEMLLAGTPDRVLEASVAMSPEDHVELAALRATLVDLAFAAPEATPSAKLRARVLRHSAPRRPKKPVVIVLDMINDHLVPGGPLEVRRARDIVPALQARLEAARRANVPVIYACDSHAPSDPDLAVWPAHAIEGTPGAEVWPEVAPAPGDTIVKKPTYSAFTGSRLQTVLDGLGADEIILTGCATEVGMVATAMDALQRGFVVTMPPDCQAGSSALGEQAAMLTLSVMPPYAPRYER